MEHSENPDTSIRDSAFTLEGILESTAQGVLCFDSDMKCRFCNESGLNMLQYETEELLLGKDVSQLIDNGISASASPGAGFAGNIFIWKKRKFNERDVSHSGRIID
jgi:PAS domain-containing protein